MKKLSLLKLLLLFVLLSIFSCTHKKKDTAQAAVTTKDSVSIIDTSFLEVKNYLFHHITKTDQVKLFNGLESKTVVGGIYADSTFTKKYVELTKKQREVLIAPFLSKELGVEKKFVTDYMMASFVSKQKRIGDLQPIILVIGGDDYGSLTMILLNRKNIPVGGYNLTGGMQSGPETIGDSVIRYERNSFSYLNNKKITTVRITETDYLDTAKTQIQIDSNVFNTVIGSDGSVATKQIVKAHYTKPFKGNEKTRFY